MSRALVTVSGTNEQIAIPAVFTAPIRLDVVHAVHRDQAKNKRQAYGVAHNAGMQHSAESWGTGRAVSRIPRVSGSGTHRAGQAAFGNMCRKGRMFAPTKTWRRWHRTVNVNIRRYAVASALAASAVPALVFARGHAIGDVEQVPLVLPADSESIKTSKAALALLKKAGAYADIERVKESYGLRAGKGKYRNRRYVQRRGPLVVYLKDDGLVKAFRNIAGVDVVSVHKLNVLQLAPGGHLGRFVVWTKGAFSALDDIFGTFSKLSKKKSGYKLPRSVSTNGDLARLISSEEIQTVTRAKKKIERLVQKKLNPLKNNAALGRLNPYAIALKKAARKQQKATAESVAAKKKADKANRKSFAKGRKVFYKTFLAPIVDKAAPKVAAEAPKQAAPAAQPEDDSLF